MKYFLNGVDIESSFGCIITNGIGPYVQLPDRKASVETDFEDEDGNDVDLATPKFAARAFAFNCTLTAGSIDQFKNQYFGLFQLLKQQGVYTLFNSGLNMTLNLFYQKQTNVSDMYKIAGGGLGITFVLNFGETDPFDNIPLIELVDDLNNVLVP